MRFFITVFAVLFLETGWLFAGSGMEGCLDHISLKIATVSTNATKSEAESTKVEKGYIQRVDVWFSHSTSTPWVTMFSSNSLTGKTKTIYENKITATNFSFYPTIHYQHTSGADVGTNGAIGSIMLFNEKIYINASNATPGTTAQSITSDVIIERK